MIDPGNLAEWAIATAIMMYNLGSAINVEADSPKSVKFVLIAWLACGVIFILLAAAGLLALFLGPGGR